MQKATPDSVLGDFNNAVARYFGKRTRFRKKGKRYVVKTQGADGKAHDYEVKYTFGVAPLQQYLVETEPGRLQTLPFAWDTRPAKAGGQRWFHVHPDEHVKPDDPLHWTGNFYNWNSNCADCHSTNLEKNYDRATRQYRTTYSEIDVSCEACHGPGSNHATMANAGGARAAGGLVTRLGAGERVWTIPDGANIAVLTRAQPSDDLETCAKCHSRRADLGGAGSYHDRYRLALLEPRLYFDDGQIHDEVYVYGSFLQSKMHAAGVVCGDCHDPHSSALHKEGNALCSNCHRATKYDAPGHHFHATGSEGAQCVACHMPERTYMQIDKRRDHRFGVPRPDLTVPLGVPNACNNCHADQSAEWAAAQIEKRSAAPPPAFATVLADARARRPGASAALSSLASSKQAGIVRATAILELGASPSQQLAIALRNAAHDPNVLVRRAAAEAARSLAPEARSAILRPLLRDEARSVRVEAAAALLEVDRRRWPKADVAAFEEAIAAYRDARAFNADTAQGLVDLAHLALLDGQNAVAESTLREAIDVDPTFFAAYVNLADLYRSLGKDPDAVAVLEQGLAEAAEKAAIHHALGLARVRLKDTQGALRHLARAHHQRPEIARYGLVYAVALFDTGQQGKAVRVLQTLHDRVPGDPQPLSLLVDYLHRLGRVEESAAYGDKLRALREKP